jgi:hypothetical protein
VAEQVVPGEVLGVLLRRDDHDSRRLDHDLGLGRDGHRQGNRKTKRTHGDVSLWWNGPHETATAGTSVNGSFTCP